LVGENSRLKQELTRMKDEVARLEAANRESQMKIRAQVILRFKKGLHRPGIEPGPPAWQASILPLNQRCFDENMC
jgi:hypothetical protein